MCDRLYFDELTFERVMDIIELEQPHGVNRINGWSDTKQPGDASRCSECAYPWYSCT